MTIEEILALEEGQTFDRKSIRIDAKTLLSHYVLLPMQMAESLQSELLILKSRLKVWMVIFQS